MKIVKGGGGRSKKKIVLLTLIAMQQEYQPRHANVEDTIREEVYGI
jgi:hypothetical protein